MNENTETKSFTTNITTGYYSTVQEAAEAIELEGLGSGGTIYDEDGKVAAQLGPDGLIEY